ncbi:hypothetical protein CYPRO_2196 [Cyclonatronum proteinivorum]|uniref:Tetratricopeptide repeat-containing protein n=1 Tax=Cyclonatronum proteinivorum TaxID=1457365 RepID=A0A345ULU2_9BACT|nr:hypothetical protein [Cyclonatronum proteinivorum]AXJ01444.1 hypothetical protein CYPRO_2196 [Cyclonatronum proteinivorum]
MFYKTANQCYKKALSDIESNNLGSAIDWLKMAINKKNEAEYWHLLACCLFETGNHNEAFDIWRDLVYQSKYDPSIEAIDYIFYNAAVDNYNEGGFYEAEDLILSIVDEPFGLNADKVYLIAMSQLKQSKFDDGWQNMEIAAQMGHDEAKSLLKRKESQSNHTNKSSQSGPNDFNKWVSRVGKYAAGGVIFALTGQITSEFFD